MRNLVSGFLLIALQLCLTPVQASTGAAVVRVRMQRDLAQFPAVAGAHVVKINDSLWSLSGKNLIFKEKKLPQNNYIVKRDLNRYDIVAILEFNEYLAGVVGNEMPVGWPLEALKVQAVVARSYALARIKERKERFFHLESDQNDQVFLVNESEKTKLAVQATDGVVLQDRDGQVLKAYYHSDCGGETVPASDVWGARAVDSGTAKDPWCAAKKSNQWSFEVSKAEFIEKLGLQEGLLNQINFFAKKAQVLPIGSQFFSVQKLREIFGFFRIRSSADVMEVTEDRVKISGQGFGHGAGLCQWGSLAQVKLGRSYQSILAHYYPKARISKDPMESLKLGLNPVSKAGFATVSN